MFNTIQAQETPKVNSADARRVAAALNAVEGIPTAALEHGAVVGLIDAVTNAISRLARGRNVNRALTEQQLADLETMLWRAYHATYQEDDREQQ